MAGRRDPRECAAIADAVYAEEFTRVCMWVRPQPTSKTEVRLLDAFPNPRVKKSPFFKRHTQESVG